MPAATCSLACAVRIFSLAICALSTAFVASNSMSAFLDLDSARRFAASSEVRALAISAAATPARGDCSISGTMRPRSFQRFVALGGGGARAQYRGYRHAQHDALVKFHVRDLMHMIGNESALRRRGALGFRAQHLEAGEYFVSGLACAGALRFRYRKLGVQVRLRGRALRLLRLLLGERSLGLAQFVFGLLQLYRTGFRSPHGLLCLLNRGVALGDSLLRERRHVGACAERREQAHATASAALFRWTWVATINRE